MSLLTKRWLKQIINIDCESEPKIFIMCNQDNTYGILNDRQGSQQCCHIAHIMSIVIYAQN